MSADTETMMPVIAKAILIIMTIASSIAYCFKEDDHVIIVLSIYSVGLLVVMALSERDT